MAPPTSQRWSGSPGEIEITCEMPGVVRVLLGGCLGADGAPFLYQKLDAQFRTAQSQHVFWDLERLEWYDTAIRARATDVLLAHRERLASIHAFSTSRLVGMGVAVVNLALGGIATVHRTRSSFERAIAAARAETGAQVPS